MNLQAGADVGRELQQHAETTRRRAGAVARELEGAERYMQDLAEARAAAVRRLAQHYLPALDDASIVNTATEVQGRLRAVQEKQQAVVASLRAAVATLNETLAGHDIELRAVTARLDACVARRQELERQAAQALQADPHFTDLATRAAEAERKLARDEERALEMAREAVAKLPAYERSTLFQYLVRRGYGTPEYRAAGLTRRLDRWVAGLLDFARAKPSYDFLRVTPPLVAAEVTRRRDEFAPVMQALRAKEAAAAEQVGLPPVLRDGEQLGAQRDQLLQVIAEARQAHRRDSESLAAAESARGTFHVEALGTLSAFLDQTQSRALDERARRTPEPQDDALVAEIASLRQRESEEGAHLRALAEQRQVVEDHAVGLERLVHRFREANFDATRSRFAGLDLAAVVSAYLDDRRTFDDTWSELRRTQSFTPALGSGAQASDGDLGGGSRVLLEAMGHVVGAALRSAAQRSVARSGSGIRVDGRLGGRGGGARGGFTRGGGF